MWSAKKSSQGLLGAVLVTTMSKASSGAMSMKETLSILLLSRMRIFFFAQRSIDCFVCAWNSDESVTPASRSMPLQDMTAVSTW